MKLICPLFLLMSGLPSQAGLAYWGSKGFVENTDSNNRIWNMSFSLTLGVFQSGFTPTLENREQWCAKWIELDAATFDPEEARFAGAVDLARSLPTGADSQVYFWAKNGDNLTQGPEWLLVTRPEWKWPATSPTSNPALTWTTDDTVSPILGLTGLRGRHLTSARIGPVPIPQTHWLARYFQNSPSRTAPDADPDGDGMNNQLEYYLGSDPSDGSSRVCPRIQSTSDGTQLTLQRNPYATSDFSVECSSNLQTWSLAKPELIQARPDLIEVRIPHDPTVKAAFFRFELKPAEQ